jgi:large subunit ribosomal protein L6
MEQRVSRIGKKSIEIPKGVDFMVDNRTIKVKGPKGELIWVHPDKIHVKINDGTVVVERMGNSRFDKSLHGLTRSIIANMLHGVSQGYQKVMAIVGIGYRAQVAGDKLTLTLGYSHPIQVPLPEGIKASVDAKQTTITLTGIDKQQLGQLAENLRTLRPPDSYKGKGIRYSGERLKLKAGKTGKK